LGDLNVYLHKQASQAIMKAFYAYGFKFKVHVKLVFPGIDHMFAASQGQDDQAIRPKTQKKATSKKRCGRIFRTKRKVH
jgi:hypothetical protein